MTTVTLSKVPFLKAAMTKALDTSFATASLTWPLPAIWSLSVSCTCTIAHFAPFMCPPPLQVVLRKTQDNHHAASADVGYSLGRPYPAQQGADWLWQMLLTKLMAQRPYLCSLDSLLVGQDVPEAVAGHDHHRVFR